MSALFLHDHNFTDNTNAHMGEYMRRYIIDFRIFFIGKGFFYQTLGKARKIPALLPRIITSLKMSGMP
jgi:hypothetical protein